MASAYRVQIIHAATAEVVYRELPGEAVEADLVENICQRVRAKGVGIGRTEAHVLADVKAAIAEVLYDLKKRV